LIYTCLSAGKEDSNGPFARALFMHQTPFDPWVNGTSDPQGFKPAFNPVNDPTAVSIERPDLFQALVSETLPLFPIPVYKVF
jgi:hypothetical protein